MHVLTAALGAHRRVHENEHVDVAVVVPRVGHSVGAVVIVNAPVDGGIVRFDELPDELARPRVGEAYPSQRGRIMHLAAVERSPAVDGALDVEETARDLAVVIGDRTGRPGAVEENLLERGCRHRFLGHVVVESEKHRHTDDAAQGAVELGPPAGLERGKGVTKGNAASQVPLLPAYPGALEPEGVLGPPPLLYHVFG